MQALQAQVEQQERDLYAASIERRQLQQQLAETTATQDADMAAISQNVMSAQVAAETATKDADAARAATQQSHVLMSQMETQLAAAEAEAVALRQSLGAKEVEVLQMGLQVSGGLLQLKSIAATAAQMLVIMQQVQAVAPKEAAVAQLQLEGVAGRQLVSAGATPRGLGSRGSSAAGAAAAGGRSASSTGSGTRSPAGAAAGTAASTRLGSVEGRHSVAGGSGSDTPSIPGAALAATGSLRPATGTPAAAGTAAGVTSSQEACSPAGNSTDTASVPTGAQEAAAAAGGQGASTADDDNAMLSAVSCSMQLSSGLQVVQHHLQLLQQGLGKLSKQYPQLLGNWQQEERKLSSTAAQLLHVEKSLASNYTCLVCMRVYHNPVACIPCGHTYCKMCLVGSLKGRCKECGQGHGGASAEPGVGAAGACTAAASEQERGSEGVAGGEDQQVAAAETSSSSGMEPVLRSASNSSSSTSQHQSAVLPGLAPVGAAAAASGSRQSVESGGGLAAGYVLIPVLDRLCSKYEVKLTALAALQSMLAERQLLKVTSSPRR